MEIRDATQLEKAKLEDTLVEILYHKYKDLVFHGGTAIWRCYSGNRFSRDLDFYLNAKTAREKTEYYRKFSEFLIEYGFAVKEKGYDNSTDTMHFLVESVAKMKIDINFKYKRGIPVEYLKVDDSKIVILSLSPLELLSEKIIAYNDRLNNKKKYTQSEVQDLYDIYYLVSLVKNGTTVIAKHLELLVNLIEETPPRNVKSLGHLILAGVPPSFELMIKRIKEWIDDNN